MGYNKDMFLVGILSWWYGEGWKQRALLIRERIERTLDFFSVSLLVRTLFAPFRQISAGKVRGPIGVQMRALLDRLMSRVIGAFLRFVMILIGSLVILLHIAWGGIIMIGWSMVPLFPVVGLLLFSIGWAPAWNL